MDFTPSDKVEKVGSVTVLYSTPGMGKTTLVSQAVKATNGLFVPIVEDGLSPLQQEGSKFDLTGVTKIPVIKAYSELVEFTRWFAKEGSKTYKTLVLDSLNLIMPSLEDLVFDKYFVTNPEYKGQDAKVIRAIAYGFGKARIIDHMLQEFNETFIKFLRWAKANKIDVIITSHETITKVKEPQQELEYDKYTLDFPHTKKVNLGKALIKEADMVLFGKRDLTLVQSATVKGLNMAIENGRVLCAVETTTYDAKQRIEMPEMIDFNYEELNKYINL